MTGFNDSVSYPDLVVQPDAEAAGSQPRNIAARAPFRGFLRGDRGRRRVRKEYVQVEEALCVAHLKRIFRLGRLRLRRLVSDSTSPVL
jgi:hypothetical protein